MENSSGSLKWINSAGGWLAKIIMLHFCWVAGVLAGLIIFGIFPATIALISIIYKWLEKEVDIPILKNFVAVYKREFVKANITGVGVVGVFLFLYMDIKISAEVIQVPPFHWFLLIVCLMFLMMSFHLLTIFVRYDLSIKNYFKQAFFITVSRPLESVCFLICLFPVYYLFSVVPVTIFFFGSSIFFLPIVFLGHRACIKAEKKRMQLSES